MPADPAAVAAAVAAYKPATAPLEHQAECLQHVARRALALFDEQGLGKTKQLIDHAALLYGAGKINRTLVIAPNDVHVQWVAEQLPQHWPAHLPLQTFVWRTGAGRAEARTRAQFAAPQAAGTPHRLLSLSYDALTSKGGAPLARAFLRCGQALLIADESHYIKTPSSLRTRAAQTLAPLADIRRIATGTPAETPFDYYAQLKFLGPQYAGYGTFQEFKNAHGIFTKEIRTGGNGKEYSYDSLVTYRQLEALQQRINACSLRRTKAQCLDLPPKLYSREHTHLNELQAAAYAELKARGMLLLRRAAGGEQVSVAEFDDLTAEEIAAALGDSNSQLVMPRIKLTMLLRLQQIAGGFIKDRTGAVTQLGATIPRAERAVELVKAAAANGARSLCWAQRTAEIELLTRLLEQAGLSVARYDGTVDKALRAPIREQFQAGEYDVMVAQPQAAGTGLNLTAATTVVYYTVGPAYIQRQQSEDRVHRIGQHGTVNIYDLLAAPCDAVQLDALRDKGSLAALLLKTTEDEWESKL